MPRRFLDRPVLSSTSELVGQPGPALISLRFVVDDEGGYLCPMSTGPVVLAEGVTTLRFHVRPRGSVEGRIPLPADEADAGGGGGSYFADLCLSSGAYALDPSRRVEVGTLGTFRMDWLPEGDHEVHVGTLDEWSRGRPRFRGKVTIAEGETAFVRLE